MSRFLVTGANGFVGDALQRRLAAAGHRVVYVARGDAGLDASVGRGADSLIVRAQTDFVGLAERWSANVRCDYAIHLAARVHVMQESSTDMLARYRETNVAGTLRVAEAALRAGVGRFLFVSSVKAMGDREPGTPPRAWSERDSPTPLDPYGISKLEAEGALREFCTRHRMELVIVRPPLVYGPMVRANFRQLLSWIARGRPLPLGRVAAQRSMIHVDNLVDAMLACLVDPAAAGETFNVSDGEDLTVADIARRLGAAMGRPARLLPVPPAVLKMAASLCGRTEQADRLLQPLRVDIRHIRALIGWRAPVDIDEGLSETALWYRDAFLSTSPSQGRT
ncbi:MAG: NAD-dependent epimerase/dehydratase family protein [Janthinobacterium lividum]